MSFMRTGGIPYLCFLLIVLKICTALSSTVELTSPKCVENIPFVLYWLDSTAKEISRLRQVTFGLVQSGPQFHLFDNVSS